MCQVDVDISLGYLITKFNKLNVVACLRGEGLRSPSIASRLSLGLLGPQGHWCVHRRRLDVTRHDIVVRTSRHDRIAPRRGLALVPSPRRKTAGPTVLDIGSTKKSCKVK